MSFLLNMNFKCLSLWSLCINLIWWLPCACVIGSDFRLQFHSCAHAVRPCSIPYSHPHPPQPTHEQVHLSRLWLFTERPVQECPTLHFCLVLCLGISTGPFADSGIPFLANLAFAVWSLMYLEVKLSRGQRKGLSSARLSRSSPQEWLMPGLREMAPCLGYRWAVYLASLICSYLTDKVEL